MYNQKLELTGKIISYTMLLTLLVVSYLVVESLVILNSKNLTSLILGL